MAGVPRLRLQWAKEHLDELDREVDRFTAQAGTCGFARESDPKDGSYVFRADIRQPPPPRLARMVVDCVNHLRSSLDNLMWQLALVHKPASAKRSIRFPVCLTEEAWLETKAGLSYLPPKVLDILETYEPYYGRKHHGIAHTAHAIWLLNRLWNYDKHRSVQMLTYIVDSAVFGPDEFVEMSMCRPHVIDDGSEVAVVVPKATATTQDKERIYGNFVIGIGFGPTPFNRAPVVRTLHHIYEILNESTFPDVEPFLVKP